MSLMAVPEIMLDPWVKLIVSIVSAVFFAIIIHEISKFVISKVIDDSVFVYRDKEK